MQLYINALYASSVNDVFVNSSCTYMASIERDDVVLMYIIKYIN